MRACILACSSMTEFVAEAQRRQGTDWPVFEVDRALHAEPEQMKDAVAALMQRIPAKYDTILVAMGFCGGVWSQVTCDRRTVLPRVDDCVSLLLHTDDEYRPNRKEPGHLYLYETDPAQFSALSLLRSDAPVDPSLEGLDPDWLFHMWFDSYHHMDIIDTGLADCYSEDYVLAAQMQADEINADLDFVPGGIRLLEKLVSGQWDAQFVVAESGQTVRHGDYF